MQNEFKENRYDSFEQLDDTLEAVYPKVVNKVLDGKGSYVKKIEGGVVVVDCLRESDFHMYYGEDNKTMQEGQTVGIPF